MKNSEPLESGDWVQIIKLKSPYEKKYFKNGAFKLGLFDIKRNCWTILKHNKKYDYFYFYGFFGKERLIKLKYYNILYG